MAKPALGPHPDVAGSVRFPPALLLELGSSEDLWQAKASAGNSSFLLAQPSGVTWMSIRLKIRSCYLKQYVME